MADDDAEAKLTQGLGIFALGAGLLISVNFVAAGMRFMSTGSPLGFARVVLVVALLWAVYRGYGWARGLAVALLAIGAFLSFFGALGAHDEALRLILVGIGGIDASFAGALVLSKPLRMFLDRQALIRSGRWPPRGEP